MSDPQHPPAGWYEDPAGGGGRRYWDGTAWTDHLAQPASILPTVAPSKPTPIWVWLVLGSLVLVVGSAIFLAIAIPTFLGAKERAEDRAAQSAARNALVAAKVIYTDERTLANVRPDTLAGIEPTLTYTNGPSTGQREVSVMTLGGGTLTLAVRSDSGTCWVIVMTIDQTGSTEHFGEMPDGTTCSAATAQGGVSLDGW